MDVKSRFKEAAAVWFTSYLFFLFFLVSNFSAAHDSINYLNNISRGEHLFHQHHLLYHFLARQWLVLWKSILPAVPEHFMIESFTAVWGSAILSVSYLFLRVRFGLRPLAAIGGIMTIGFSFGVWFYSTNIEVYTPPAFFIIWCLYLVSAEKLSVGIGWLVGVLNSMAVLFHQVNVLFAVVMIICLYARRGSIPAGRVFIQYAVTSILLAGGTYFLIGWFVERHNSLSAWIAWMEGYTVGHGYWQPLSLATPLHVITGFAHAFVGGHFVFRLPAVETWLKTSFESHGLADEVYLASGISHTMAWLLTILSLLLALIMGLMLFRFLINWKILIGKAAYIFQPLLACLFVYSLFFCFWMPEILEFWIIQMILVWLILAGSLAFITTPWKGGATGALMLTAVLLFTINFFGSMTWLDKQGFDLYFKKVEPLSRIVRQGDLVLVEDGWILRDFMIRYLDAPVISSGDPDYSAISTADKIEQTLAGKGRVYVYPGTEKPGTPAIEKLLKNYDGRKIRKDGDLFYVIE